MVFQKGRVLAQDAVSVNDNRKLHTFLTVRSGAEVRVGVAVPRLVLDAWIGTTGGRHQTHRSVPMDRVHPRPVPKLGCAFYLFIRAPQT